MFWNMELCAYLEAAPWPATKDELIDFALRSGAPMEVVDNLQELPADGFMYETMGDIWNEYSGDDSLLLDDSEGY
jgi:hypothetical protein